MLVRPLFAGLCALSFLFACGSDPEPPAVIKDVRVCNAPSPCPTYFVEDCLGMPCGQTMYLDNQACALAELGKGARAHFDISSSCEGMCAGDLLFVRGDGKVYKQPYFGNAPDLTLDAPSLCELADKAYFDACAAKFDETCLYESNWLSGCVEVESIACQ